MKLIIDIPDWYYHEVQEFKHLNFVDKAISEGIILPKGHGRLIDADATIKEFGEWTDEWDKFAIGCLESADTIVEADK